MFKTVESSPHPLHSPRQRESEIIRNHASTSADQAPTTSTAPASNSPRWGLIILPEPTPPRVALSALSNCPIDQPNKRDSDIQRQRVLRTPHVKRISTARIRHRQRQPTGRAWPNSDYSVVAGGGGYADSSDPVVTVGPRVRAVREMWVNVSTWTDSNFGKHRIQGQPDGRWLHRRTRPNELWHWPGN